MSGTAFEDQMKWRNKLERGVFARTEEKVKFIHPPMFYNYEYISHQTEAEIKEWELSKLAECRVMVVDLNGVNTSTGTHMELGFANAMNMMGNRHIFVIGLGSTDGLHPWIRESLFRVAPTISDACDYIVNYLLD